MSCRIQRVDYFYATVRDEPGQAYRMLSQLARSGVNLLAFSAVPAGLEQTQLMLFPEDSDLLSRVADETGITLAGPQHALLIQGDDELGALVDFHRRLYDARINVYASTGLADSRGGFGYVLYVRSEDIDEAARVLGV